jgi:RNA polymerase sigma-70 factor (family 1)
MLYDCYTDDDLFLMLRNDDRSAFTEIYSRYWKSMFTVAANKLGDAFGAEELVQEIFTDLWARRMTLEISGSPKAYLSVAVKYKVIDARLKRSRKMLHEQQAGMKAVVGDCFTEQTVHFNELKERLSALVEELPEHCRLIYQLSREEGVPNREIAQRLNLSEKTVEYHMTKALKTLRTSLQQFFATLLLSLLIIIPTFF